MDLFIEPGVLQYLKYHQAINGGLILSFVRRQTEPIRDRKHS